MLTAAMNPEKRNWPRENAKNTKEDRRFLKEEGWSDCFPLNSFLRPSLCALGALCGHSTSEFGLSVARRCGFAAICPQENEEVRSEVAGKNRKHRRADILSALGGDGIEPVGEKAGPVAQEGTLEGVR